MGKILNITNGDSAVEIMKQADIAGEFLPWRDVLHDGPVPQVKSLENLSKIRAKFIADCGWGDHDTIHNSFLKRDNTLKSFHQYDKVILWFEHDLYDQLQILQILDWFQKQTLNTPVSIICTNQYLGLLSADEMKQMFSFETEITSKQLALAEKAWSAFSAKTPEKWQALLTTNTSAIPFLEGAIIRQLEEYPSCQNGLSRTANQMLKIIAEGEKNCWKIFSRSQEMEDCIFMGDSSFWLIMKTLIQSETPLLKLGKNEKWKSRPERDTTVSITEIGKDVLAHKQNWLELSTIDQWIGGVHINNHNLWCWNEDLKSIAKK